MRFVIRPAKPEDGERIAAMAAALAAHEGDRGSLFTAAEFRDQVFGDRGVLFALVVDVEGVAQGYMLFYEGYESEMASPGIHVADIFVEPGLRRHGVGRALFAAVAKECVNRDGSWLAWEADRTNESAHAFYRAIDAKSDEYASFFLEGDAMRRLARS
jgi:GNAT superfamily N-acetyltransferase